VLSALLIAYNNTINFWPPFHSWAYVPCNLALTVALVVLSGPSPPPGSVADAVVGLALAAPVALALLLVSGTRHRGLIADERVAGLGGAVLAYHTLVRIPLGTAVTEEVLFRGVLFEAWLAAGSAPAGAALWSALAFGLWHVAPSAIGLRLNDPEARPDHVAGVVAAAVVVSALAGLALTWLRLASGGLLAPIALHGAVNSGAAFAAARAGGPGPSA
jgi:membrane protease YdiL (CAAX protease family)